MRQHPIDRLTVTVPETAALLGISRGLAYQLARACQLPVPTLRLGRRLVVPRAALERWLAGEQTALPTEAS